MEGIFLSLISLEKISGIYFIFYIIQDLTVTVCDDTVAQIFKFIKIIDNFASKEGRSVLQGWFLDDHGSTLGFDSLHDSLNRRLTDVVRVGFHSQTINTYSD